MTSSLSSALGNLLQSLTSIGASLLHSFIAVITAIVALLQNLFVGIFQLAQSFVAFGINLFQGVVGFVVGM